MHTCTIYEYIIENELKVGTNNFITLNIKRYEPEKCSPTILIKRYYYFSILINDINLENV